MTKSLSMIIVFAAAVLLVAVCGGCKPASVNKTEPPAVAEPDEVKDPPATDPITPPADTPPSSDPAPGTVPPTTPPDSGSGETPSADPSEPNWDSATHAEISAGEFVYDPGAKIWVCYSSDTPAIAWKIEGTGKYPVPKDLDAAAICSCCGYHGVKLVLMTPKEWENPSAGQEKGRTAKRAVVMSTGDTKFDGPGCGGTCSCHDEEKK